MTPTDDSAVRELLTDITGGEPFFAPDIDRAMADGRRLRRRRGVVRALGAAGVATVAVTAVALVGPGGGLGRPPTPVTGTGVAGLGTSAATSSARSLPAAEATSPVVAQMLSAIRSTSPGLDLSGLVAPQLDSGWQVDGNVDDGSGAARLMVMVVPASAGGINPRSCADIELHANGSCSTTTLADGSILSVQGISGTEGYRTANVVLVHPDGSAVLAEADNAATALPLAALQASAGDQVTKQRMRVTRPETVLTKAQLTSLVRAVDRAVG